MISTPKSMIWKIRNVKNYAGAHNHLTVGQVLETTDAWVRIQGFTFHFAKNVMTLSDIKCGALMVRIIPWNRIEVVNELPADFDLTQADLQMNDTGGVILTDGRFATPVTTSYEKAL